jgi:hypothetical protein
MTKTQLDNKKLRLILSGLLGLSVLVFLGITLGGLSVLQSKSKQIVELKVQNQTAEAQLSNLEQTKKDIEKYSYFKDVAKTVIPSDKDQAEAVLEINQMANESNILIQSINFPASSLGATTSTLSTSSQDATSAASKTTAISQARPVSGIAGLYSLELIITPQTGANTPTDKQITYDKMLDFLRRIENNRHTAQITNVTIAPANAQQTINFTLTINIFIKP